MLSCPPDARACARLLARRLNALARGRLLLGLAVPLLLVGAALFCVHLRSSRVAETRCRITAAEELGFLTVRLEHQVNGVTHLSGVIASCKRPEGRRKGCGEAVGTTTSCFYFTVQPGEVFAARPRPDRVPGLPALLLGLGALLLLWSLILRLTAPAADDASTGGASLRELEQPAHRARHLQLPRRSRSALRGASTRSAHSTARASTSSVARPTGPRGSPTSWCRTVRGRCGSPARTGRPRRGWPPPSSLSSRRAPAEARILDG